MSPDIEEMLIATEAALRVLHSVDGVSFRLNIFAGDETLERESDD